jgi:hypothetical protein
MMAVQSTNLSSVIPGRHRQVASPESITLTPWLWIPGSRLKSGLPDFSIKGGRNRQQPISIERAPE